ncbi:aspartyl protease family protein [Sphingomonas palmae]|uniref:Aspartyl protease family protein n=2 Tax=Sphingomonas palmae TaxID=1855283 RepID=A0A1H7KK06_9SPHN|nr:aspartyl protease family protein [Sphingomonas palmae]
MPLMAEARAAKEGARKRRANAAAQARAPPNPGATGAVLVRARKRHVVIAPEHSVCAAIAPARAIGPGGAATYIFLTMSTDLAGNTHFYILIGVLLLASVIARRVPVLRTLVSLAVWAGLAGLLYMVVAQRERFDPWMGRMAAALDIESQQVSGEETRIRMSPDGHFYVRAQIGGVEKRLLVDSGATITALSPDTAAAAGVEVKPALFPVVLQTANGAIRAETGEVKELRFGNVVARDLAVVVSPAFGNIDVIGMNFLSRLKSWRVEGRTLILTPHHPQDTDV